MRILICDDDPLQQEILTLHLEALGHRCNSLSSGEECVQELIKNSHYNLLILDLYLPEMDGLETLSKIHTRNINIVVILMTAYGDTVSAQKASENGVYAYLNKPLDWSELEQRLEEVEAVQQQKKQSNQIRIKHDSEKNLRISSGKSTPPDYGQIIGRSNSMKSLYTTLEFLEDIPFPTVLIYGESGTGKDLIARAIHQKSVRKNHPLITIDCASLPGELIESELFGHEKGAFTDAKSTKKGLFETAQDGTVFLDEIGEMHIGTQAKLLRALENKEFRRIGGLKSYPLRVAIIAASNRNILEEVKKGNFREDLYFRLNVFPVTVPPLRKRSSDIPLLVSYFTERFSQEMHRKNPQINPKTMEVLQNYPWPGNVRELKNNLERLMILSKGVAQIQPSDLSPEIRFPSKNDSYEYRTQHTRVDSPIKNQQHLAHLYPKKTSLRSRHCAEAEDDSQKTDFLYFPLPAEGLSLEKLEKDFLLQALRRSNGNKRKAAKLLDISRHALRYRLQKFDIS